MGETLEPVRPVVKHLLRLYSDARNTHIQDRKLREEVRQRYLTLKECMQGFFPVPAIEIPSMEMDPPTKASCVRELGARGALLKQYFGMPFWFHMRGRPSGAEAVFIRRDFFDNLESWLETSGLRAGPIDGGEDRAEEDTECADEKSRRAENPGESDIDKYFRAAEASLRLEFEKRRSLLTDSDAKAGGNEKAVGEFLQKHVGSARIAFNKQVIDSHGMRSGEMDVCACNLDQLSLDEPLIIAEGVDFVVQVKAVLTDAELLRIVKNCRSLTDRCAKIFT